MSTVEHETQHAPAHAGRAEELAFPGKYLSLTSYRRDGTPVATPVWFVEDGGRLLVATGSRTGKVKRIRRDPTVSVAPCSALGALRGAPVEARARILPASARELVEPLLARKYRVDRILILPLYRLAMRLEGRGASVTGDELYLEITPTPPV
jgi:PPOX class probable F420-dependent enzyme